MKQVEIAGLKVCAATKKEFLEDLKLRLENGQQTFLTTLYSEFLYASLKDRNTQELLSRADLAVADGIALPLAQTFLSKPLTAGGYFPKIIQAFWQAKITLASALFFPSQVKKIIPEKIVGADIVWDIAGIAERKNLSVFLLGGFGDTAEIAGRRLKEKFPNLKLAGCSNKNPDDADLIRDIQEVKPDILLVAYGPIRQEKWIAKNLPSLPIKLAVGVGGTFDYIAGKKPVPPRFLREHGLEWAWRLFTQPKRFRRIFQATFGLMLALVKYKLFTSLPYRQNAVSVVLNKNNQILLGRFNPQKHVLKALAVNSEHYQNYWQLPQGGIDEGEEILEAARRELWEETSIRNVEVIKVSDLTYSYKWKEIANRPLLVTKRYQYCGQQQHIVYFRFTGEEKEIVLDWDEFSEYKWVSVEDFEHSVHEEKQPMAKVVKQGLMDLGLIKSA